MMCQCGLLEQEKTPRTALNSRRGKRSENVFGQNQAG